MAAAETPIRIRRIGPDDGPILRDLRLRSLADAPEAFGQPIEEALAQPDAEWVAAARAGAAGERRAWFLAEVAPRDGGPARTVGLVLGRRRPPATLLIFSMWVDPTVRRGGVGGRLIEEAEAWAGSWNARRTVLWVYAGNEPALRFYRRLRFRVEEDGEDARTGAQYGALAMVRAIDTRPMR